MSRKLEKVYLTPEILRYAFSNVFSAITKEEKAFLIKKIHEQRSILSARRMRRATFEALNKYRDTISKYLLRKTNRDNINITLLLLSTEPFLLSKIQDLFINVRGNYSSAEIAEILRIDSVLISGKIYDFERSVKRNILFKDTNNARLRLVVSRADNQQKRLKILLETFEYVDHDDIEKIVFHLSGGKARIDRFIENPSSYLVRDLIENWTPSIFYSESLADEHLIDIYIISEKAIRHVRFYDDGVSTVFIFDRSALSLLRPSL
jgi:hypothetical protein